MRPNAAGTTTTHRTRSPDARNELASRVIGGRKPKLTTRQVGVARQMYGEKGADGKRRYTVAEIAETFHVSCKTIYRHLRASTTAHVDQTATGRMSIHGGFCAYLGCIPTASHGGREPTCSRAQPVLRGPSSPTSKQSSVMSVAEPLNTTVGPTL